MDRGRCGVHATCEVNRPCSRTNTQCICQQQENDSGFEKIDHLFAKHVCLVAAAVLENMRARTECN